MKLINLFLKQSGLTMDEANDFLIMRTKKLYPEMLDDTITPKQMLFLEQITKEAKEWKRNGHSE